MPNPVLPTFTITGQPPLPGDPFTLDLLPQFATDNSVQQYREWTPEELGTQPPPSEAFAPPPPVELPVMPDTIVQGGTSVLGNVLRGVLWFLFPQPTGPREHDELDTFDVIAPPPPPKPPTTLAPDMPPNWRDYLTDPDAVPYNVPKMPLPVPDHNYPVEMPDGEKYFDVKPPKVTPRDTIRLSPPIIELPYFDDFGVDLRPGPTPTPTSTPRSDPVSPDLFPEPVDVPQRVPQPDRPGEPAPDIFSPTLPDGFGDPIGDPFSPPELPAPPRTVPRTPAIPGDSPLDFLDPTFTPKIDPISPLVEFGPDKLKPEAETCGCAKKDKNKKKKKKERDVCYRGTYYETKRGLSKVRIEQVTCADHPPKKERKPREKKPRKPKLKPGQFPGLGLFLVPQP